MHEILFNLLLVLLPTQLGLHMWPSWAMVLGRRVDFLSPTLFLTDILAGLTIISWAVNERNKFLNPDAHVLLKSKNFQLAILLLAFIFINILSADNRMVSAYGWLKVLEYVLLGLYILKTKPKISRVTFFLSIGVLYSSLIAVAQFILQRSVGGPLWFLGERTFSNISPGIAQFNVCNPFTNVCALVLRAYGTFPHPNVLGGFLAVILPLIFYQIWHEVSTDRNRRTFYLFAMAIGILTLALTYSRSAWVATLLGFSAVLYALLKKKMNFLPLIIIDVFILVLVGGTVGLQDESVVVREALNSSAIQMFKESPFFGKGISNFLVELPKNLPSRQIYFLQPVHNIYLLILAETGIVGFAIFAWTLWKCIENARKKFSIFHISLLTILLLGFVDHYPLTLQQGQLMFTIFLSLVLIR